MGFEALYRAMFSDSMPRDEAARFEDRVQEESRRVLMDIGGSISFPPLPKRKLPVLVLGAEKDLLFPPDQVHATAWAFGADATFFPDMGHSMMLQPGWESSRPPYRRAGSMTILPPSRKPSQAAD